MTRNLILIWLLVCSVCKGLQAAGAGTSTGFRENTGQVHDQWNHPRTDIQFQFCARNMNVFIGQGQIHYQWYRASSPVAADTGSGKNGLIHTCRLDVTLLGADPAVTPVALNELPGRDIYYTGGLNGRAARSFSTIIYKDIYPGIDWVLYLEKEGIKYDFVVHPGANASQIRLRYSGATDMRLQDGALLVTSPLGSLREHKPYSYVAETKAPVASAFSLDNNILGFLTDTCTGTLVIDPVVELDWASYYGGAGLERSSLWGVSFYSYSNTTTTDWQGNVYLCGTTDGLSNIATTGAFQSDFSGGAVAEPGTETYIVYGDVFLVKFDRDGQRLWATYYGGEKNEHNGCGHSVACDSAGNVYMAGSSNSRTGIATAGAHQDTLCDPEAYFWKDNFLVKFNQDGVRQWATYYGGRGHEEGGSVLVSADGSQVYLCASATSYENIATTGAAITTAGNAAGVLWNTRPTGYIARFDNTGHLLWGTYIGNRETANPVYDALLDKKGKIYITGFTQEGLPGPVSIATPGAFQTLIGGGPDPRPPDAFLQQWDSTGSRLWGTFYGGTAADRGFALAMDEDGDVYMAGNTESTTGNTYGVWSIATPGSVQPVLSGGGADAFIVKFNETGQRIWGRYYGQAAAQEEIASMAFAGQELLLLGTAYGKNYGMATECAYQALGGGGSSPVSVFLSGCTGDGVIDYSTYYGGTGADYGYSLAADKTDPAIVYIAGYTSSNNAIATENGYQTNLNGPWDAYLARFNLPGTTYISSCYKSDSILLQAHDTTGSLYQWSNGQPGISLWAGTSGTYWVYYQQKPGCYRTDTFRVTLYPLPRLTLLKSCAGQGAAQATVLSGNQNSYTYTWKDAAGNELRMAETESGDELSGLAPGDYSLSLHTPGGCATLLYFTMEAFPGVDLEVCADTVILAGASVRLWAGGAVSYRWQPALWLDDPAARTPVSRPEAAITYTVKGINEYGCSATGQVHIDVVDDLLIPNAFSPNGDGVNDEFKPVNTGYRHVELFRIFNRWGGQVFTTTDPGTGWDGSYHNKPADAGTYYYYIRLVSNDGSTQSFKGDLTLLR